MNNKQKLLTATAITGTIVSASAFTVFDYAICRRKKQPDVRKKEKWKPYLDYVLKEQEWLKEHQEQELKEIRSKDGLTLRATYIPRENVKGTIICMHGYHSTNDIEFVPEVRFLWNLGYSILLPWQRSHGKSEGRYITYGVKERHDLKRWILYTNRHLAVKNKDIFLCGISMGCATTLMAAGLDLPDNVKGIILNGGENRVVDGKEVEVRPELYTWGYPVISVDYPASRCDVRFDSLPDQETLKKFVFDECKAEANWNMKNFIEDQVELIRRQVGDRKVLLALSGGVDSSVVAAMLIKAIGQQLVCVHVNHGLMRKNESESVVEVFRNQLHANLIYVDATERFLGKLENVSDPEEKRKIIGGEFIRVFEEEARKLEGIDFLGQGTIYPDIIESGTKTAKMVKSHHNVGGLPEDLQFELVEPLKQLFKDEVRACGIELGLPAEMVYRQPFPGPGLGVRCLGAITRDRLEAVRESDAILREEFAKAGLDKKVWQYFTVVPDFKSVGMKNHARCFEYMVIIRAINTIDAMTASIEHVDWEILDRITNRILAEVENVNRVCYDMSPKPPATIEFE